MKSSKESTYLKQKLGENLVGIITVMSFLMLHFLVFPKNDNALHASNIKLTVAKNFISDLSREMGASMWDFGLSRTKNDSEFMFLGGTIKFQQCTSLVKEKVDDVYHNRHKDLVIKDRDVLGKYLCIDNDILLSISVPGEDCDIVFSAKWRENYNNCAEKS